MKNSYEGNVLLEKAIGHNTHTPRIIPRLIVKYYSSVVLPLRGAKVKPYWLAELYLFKFWDLEHFEHSDGKLLTSTIGWNQQPIASTN